MAFSHSTFDPKSCQVLTCSPADPRPVHKLHSWVPAIHWVRTVQSAAYYRTTDPTGHNAVLQSSLCSADKQEYFRMWCIMLH